jgi:hypothetical protein
VEESEEGEEVLDGGTEFVVLVVGVDEAGVGVGVGVGEGVEVGFEGGVGLESGVGLELEEEDGGEGFGEVVEDEGFEGEVEGGEFGGG